jgi:hypothetical protein
MSGFDEERRLSSNDELHRPFDVSTTAVANESETTSDCGIRSLQVPQFDPRPQETPMNEAAAAVTRLASFPNDNFNQGGTAANGGAVQIPRLRSGVPIDAKNTLQSNTVVVAAAVEASLLENADAHRNQDFYKHIHGISSLDAAADRASQPHAEDTESSAAQAVPAMVHRDTGTRISPLTEPPPPTPMVVFANARFVEDETTAAADAQAANALPIQAIHADSMTNATLTTGNTSTDGVMPPPSTNKAQQNRPRKLRVWQRWGLLLLGVVVLGAVVAASVCGTTKCAPSRSPNAVSAPPAVQNDNSVGAFINGITLTGRTIAVLAATESYSQNSTQSHELAEELALQWVTYRDPLELVPDTAVDRFRLQQRYALSTLLLQVQGDNQTLVSDECDWSGIACRERNVGGDVGMQKVVTEIDWHQAGLGGHLSADLALLPFVELFIVSNNLLSGSLPIALSRWTNLRNFSIGFNRKLFGPIPSSFAQWISMQYFSAPSNALTGALPPGIIDWLSLEHFDVARNRLNGTLSWYMSGWTHLEYFNIADNSFTGSLPLDIGQWTNLVHFDAGWNGYRENSMNRLTGDLLSTLDKWTALTHLDAGWNRFVGSLSPSFQRWTSLETLNVRDNDLTGSLWESFGKWSNLTTLHISGCRFDGSLAESFGNWSKLESFIAEDSLLVGRLPESAARWTNLREFIITFNMLTGSLLDSVGRWTKLERIDLGGNRFTGTLPTYIGLWTNLLSFSASDNALIGSLPDAIGQWTDLSDLFNVDRNNLTGSLPESIGEWSDLFIFSVSGNRLTGTVPVTIANWTSIWAAYFEENSFTGFIPDTICATNTTRVLADFALEVSCSCCICDAALDFDYQFDEDDRILPENR